MNPCLDQTISTSSSSIPIQEPEPTHIHSMTTRSQYGIFKPNPKYNIMHIQVPASSPKYPTLQPVKPRTIVQAMQDTWWREATSKEFNALFDNKT